MLVVDKRKKWFIKLETVHFIENYTQYKSNADVVYFEQSKNSPGNVKQLYTLHIDLSKPEEELYSELNRTTKKGLSKVEKNCNFKYFLHLEPSHQDVSEFYDIYNGFCWEKKLKPVALKEVNKYWETGNLAIAGVTDAEKGKLNSACYIMDQDKLYARGWLTGSYFRSYTDPGIRNLIGLANRYSIWQSIRTFKRLGFLVYDFGGITLQKDNIEMSNIDNFKMGFGGSIVTEYNFRYGETNIGKFALSFYNIKNKVMSHILSLID